MSWIALIRAYQWEYTANHSLIVIMSLAYAQRTDDNAWLASHYTLLNQWVGYLIQEALIPANQISTDDFAGSLA